MDKQCSSENCPEKVYFSCSCKKHFCEPHSEKHSSVHSSHELNRLYRAVDSKTKANLVTQAKAKLKIFDDLKQKTSEKVEKLKNTIDNFFMSWKVGIEEQERYLMHLVENLEKFDIILINENQKVAEELGCIYNVRETEFFDLEEYLDRMFRGIEVYAFQVRMLNQPIGVESKLSVLESQGVFVEGIASMVLCLAISKDEKLLAMGCLDKTIKIWETESFNQIGVLKGHSSRVLCTCFSPSTPLLASGSRDNSIILWDPKEKCQLQVLQGHTSDVLSLIIKSIYLISSSADKSILLWSLKSNELIHSFNGHKAQVNCIAAGFNIKTIISGSDDKTLIFWNTFAGIKEELKNHKMPIKALVLSEDEKILASGSTDKSVIIWNPLSKKMLIVLNHNDKVNTLFMNTNYLISGCKDKVVTIWDLKNFAKEFEYKVHNGQIIALAALGNGRKIFSSSDDQSVKIFDFKRKEVGEYFSGHCEAVLCIAATHDCRYVVTGSRDDTIRLWNIMTKKQEHIFEGHLDYIKTLAVTGDNKFIISGSLDNTLKVWDIQGRSLVLELVGHNSSVNIVAITDSQEFVITGGADRNIIVWDLNSFSCSRLIKNFEDLKQFLVKFPELIPYNFFSVFE